MPVRGQAPDIVRIVEGVDGELEMASDLVVRFDHGRAVPWVHRQDDALTAIAGPNALPARRQGASWQRLPPPCQSWFRDATMALYALLTAGYRHEAIAWREWMLRLGRLRRGRPISGALRPEGTHRQVEPDPRSDP